jgi:outer membrane protein OmpA-like peptidoglycan-associated protein
LLLLVASAAAAPAADLAGAKDHPLFKRYEGSAIIGYEVRPFDEAQLLLGKLRLDNGQPAVGDAQRVTGKRTRLLYAAPPQRSAVEIFANYEEELRAAGFAALFRCAGESECDEPGAPLVKEIYPPARRLRNGDPAQLAFNVVEDPRYLAARLARPEGDVFVQLYVAVERGSPFPQTQNRALVLLDVIEAKPMEHKMVIVDAAAMAKDLAASGKVALSGIYFDTDKAELKSQSQPALDEIAKLLRGDPALKVYIVGHTDNVGGFDYNMALSQRRARAVVERLVAAYGIAPARLKPVGAGLIAPVASNDDETGRAKNRRVEIVKE